MAYGGGTFVKMDKKLAGTYINNISQPKQLSLFGDRGIVAIGYKNSFGNKGDVIKLSSSDFAYRCKEIFGYDVWHEKMLPFRELFVNASEVIIYNLGENAKAKNTYAEALKGGTRGNALAIKIQANVDEPEKKDVITLLDNEIVDKQTVSQVSELKSNKYVKFLGAGDISEPQAKVPLTSGSDGEVTAKEHTEFLGAMEKEAFNVLLCDSMEKAIQNLYIEHTKRLRDTIGIYFTLVLHGIENENASFYNDKCVTVVHNKVKNKGLTGNELLYYVAGESSSVKIGETTQNKAYRGELEINADFTNLELIDLKENGKYVYHKVGDEFRVLEDINGKITITDVEGEEFKENQVIRAIDALSIADSTRFNKTFMSKNINISSLETFKNALMDVREQFVEEGALKGFNKDSIEVKEVEGQRGVIMARSEITPPECFKTLYITNVLTRGGNK